MVLFRTMGTAKERWMNDYSVVMDCMYAALNNGGILKVSTRWSSNVLSRGI